MIACSHPDQRLLWRFRLASILTKTSSCKSSSCKSELPSLVVVGVPGLSPKSDSKFEEPGLQEEGKRGI